MSASEQVETPPYLAEALAQDALAQRRWQALPDWDRARYVRWVSGPDVLRRRRIRATVRRVRQGLPQRGVWGRVSESVSPEVGEGFVKGPDGMG